MNVKTKLKLDPGHKSLVHQPTQSGNNDTIPQLVGAVGGTVGQILGTPFDLVSGPGGTIAGGAGLGGIAQGGAQAVQNLVTGKPLMQNVGQEAGQGALFGAIPGGAEMRGMGILGRAGIKGLAARTAARAGTGYVAGGVSQELQNTEGGQQGNPMVSGGISGALNAVAPGVSSILKLPVKAVGKLGKVATESATNILEKKFQPEIDRMQMLFGKRAIATGGGVAKIHPDVQKLLTQHPEIAAAIPPKGDISQFEPALTSAATKVENALQPILSDPKYGIKSDQLSKIVNDNMGTFFGSDAKNNLKQLPVAVNKFLTSAKQMKGFSMTLSNLKGLQREIGKVGGTDWSQPATSPLEKWARQTYQDIGKIYDEQLSKSTNGLNKSDYETYHDLINQHKLILHAKDAIQGQLKGKSLLPKQLTSEGIAQEKAQQGLGAERLRELGVRSIPGLAALAANTIPGTPTEVKYAADAGALGYSAAQFGPHLNPEQALQIGQALQRNPQMGDVLTRALAQLGVRIPMMTNQSQ